MKLLFDPDARRRCGDSVIASLALVVPERKRRFGAIGKDQAFAFT
jgi:hypothetical protein